MYGPSNAIRSVASIMKYITNNYQIMKWLQVKLEELLATENKEHFQTLMDDFEERFYAGVTQIKVAPEYRKKLAGCISKCMEKSNQVKGGMNYGNVLSVLQRLPECSI